MAIGLARMFGFQFRENFDYPYVAASVQRFLAALAHLALDVVPRLSLRAARREPRHAAARLSESDDRVLPVRALARRELDVRGVGPLPRVLPGLERPGSARVLERARGCCGTLYIAGRGEVGWVFFRAACPAGG